MKFKARIKDTQLLFRVASTLKMIQEKTVLLHITPKKTQFIVRAEAGDQFQDSIFEDHVIESKSENRISFSISLEGLVRTLKAAQTACATWVRLTKRFDAPVLSFQIELTPDRNSVLTQDIPIELMTPQQFESLHEPQLPDPEVFILMPLLKNLRFVIEKLKNLDEFIVIHATMRGELSFQIKNEVLESCTFYRNLEHPSLQGKDASQMQDAKATAKLKIKQLARFLHCHQVNPQNVICCIVENRSVVLHALVEDLYLTYYLPVIAETDIVPRVPPSAASRETDDERGTNDKVNATRRDHSE